MEKRMKKAKASLAISRRSIIIKRVKQENGASTSLQKRSFSQQIAKQTVESVDSVQLQRPYVVNAVRRLYAQIREGDNGKELFDDDKVIFLQITVGKIPKGPHKHIQLVLEHSVLPKDHDILLITSNVKHGKSAHEDVAEHYRAYLDRHQIPHIKEIIPLQQLQKEYTEFEMQSKLVGLYDLIMADSAVDAVVRKTIGTMIKKQNKLYSPVKMHVTNVRNAFAKAIGHTGMEQVQLVDNVMVAAKELSRKLPGGFTYIRNLFLKTARGKALQFYYSQLNYSPMKVPVIKMTRPKMSKPVKGELSTKFDAQVTVTASGDVIVHTKKAELTAKHSADAEPKPQHLETPALPKKMKGRKKLESKENGDVIEKRGPVKDSNVLPLTETAKNRQAKGARRTKRPEEDAKAEPTKANGAVTQAKNSSKVCKRQPIECKQVVCAKNEKTKTKERKNESRKMASPKRKNAPDAIVAGVVKKKAKIVNSKKAVQH